MEEDKELMNHYKTDIFDKEDNLKNIFNNFETKESETAPPSRYNSGSIILAMENAGKLIEDESLREQIKGARNWDKCNKRRNNKEIRKNKLY